MVFWKIRIEEIVILPVLQLQQVLGLSSMLVHEPVKSTTLASKSFELEKKR